MSQTKITPENLVIGVCLAAVAALLIAGALWSFDPFNRRQRAEMKAANAVEQSRATETVAKAVDTFHTNTVIIRERGDRASRAVEQAPGAPDAIDPDRRAILCAALAGVRQSPVCEAANGDDTAGTTDAVQGSDKPDGDTG